MTETISIVCFKWNNGFRKYKAEHVNKLARMVNKHLPEPHRFICVTDNIEGFDSGVEAMLLPESAEKIALLPSPEGKHFPSSYRRLWTFSDEARCLGDRVMMLDIDCVITGDLSPLFEPQDNFIGWRPRHMWGKQNRIGGGTWLLRTGTHTWIWDDFIVHPIGGIKKSRQAGWRGSDQAYLSYRLSDKCAVWPKNCGIYQKQDGVQGWAIPPADAKIIHFNGNLKPWDKKLANRKWING